MSAASPHPTEALVALVYGELGKDEAQRVQQHVDGCPECAAALERYRDVRRAAAALPRAVEDAPGLAALLHSGAPAAARARRRRVVVRAGALLASAAALGLLVLVVRPRAPESPAVVAASPSAVGALAENDVQPAPKADEAHLRRKQELPQEPARQRAAAPATAAPSSRATAAKARPPSAVADAKGGRELQGQAEGAALVPRLAETNRPASTAPVAQPAPLEKRAAVIAGAPAGAAAGAAALKKAPADVGGAKDAEARADAVLADKALQAPDGGPVAQRRLDEGRRQELLARLETASVGDALALLSELCALDVRLAERAEAARVCERVVRTYPETPEAARARAQLDALRTP